MAKSQGMNNQSIKNNNRGLVLRTIMQRKAVSRVEIAEVTGLTKMAVSNITSELIADHYIIEGSEYKLDTRGRSPMSLQLSPQAPKIIGVYIGRSIIEVAVTTLNCEAYYAQHLSLSQETEASIEKKIYYLIDNALKHVSGSILGISVSAVGLVDYRKGIVSMPIPFFDTRSINITQILRKKYDTVIVLNNDMNNAALLENFFGAGRTYRDFVYVGITSGLGMGIITEGRLHNGACGFSGELAHMSIDYNGPVCPCGRRGCLETYASIPVICRRLEQATGHEHIDPFDFDEVSKIPAADEVLTDVMDKLSCGLANVVNQLDLRAVIIGHEGSFIPQKYIRYLEAALNSITIFRNQAHVDVAITQYADEWVPYRAAAGIAEGVFSGRIYV